MDSEPRSAYVHVPFCAHRCGYCNFTLVARRPDLVGRYLLALERELSWLASPRPVETLFIGGGTPTYLMPHDLAKLLTIVLAWLPAVEGCEFTVEANPGGLDAERVAILAEHGVTRLSLGAQSFNEQKLKTLERDHAPADIAAAVTLARRHLKSVSLDLIFAAPGEKLDDWRRDLRQALSLAPDHLSTYGLTYERGTTFWTRRRRGELSQLDEELEREMYAAAIDTLSAADFEHYEVSNFARAGHRCRHNEIYWAGLPYYAAGPGAARYVAGCREMNHRSTSTWLARVMAGQSPVDQRERLSAEDRAREMLVFGLRRLAGVSRERFARATGYELDDLAGHAISRHVAHGLLEDSGGRVRLTREGLFVSDAIWPDLLRV
ncbi:MAG TPA: radical SAM family heme chaperone HemW [Pirellulales bacterium]